MSTAPAPRPRGRLLLAMGPIVAALGLAAYAAQLGLGRLAVPWYMPALAFLGAAIVAASFVQRRTIARALTLVALVALGGLELLAIGALTLPAYAGPVAVGMPFPAFSARMADGSAFTREDLVGDRDAALVFFRGRW